MTYTFTTNVSPFATPDEKKLFSQQQMATFAAQVLDAAGYIFQQSPVESNGLLTQTYSGDDSIGQALSGHARGCGLTVTIT